MTPPEARALLALEVAAVLPAEWTVYAAPPEQMSLPAAVIAPRTPYRRPGTFCVEVLSLAVWLLESRSASVEGIDNVDTLSTDVRNALTGVEGLAYESTDMGPMTAPGGVETYGVALNIDYYI